MDSQMSAEQVERIQRPEPQYQVCDDRVAYRGDRVAVVDRWWIGDYESDGTWMYMVKVIRTGWVIEDVPEGNLWDW